MITTTGRHRMSASCGNILNMEIYHILNRGVDKRVVVKNDQDRMRFLQGLFMYNDKNTLGRNARRKPSKRRGITQRDLLVNIHAFCLMDNHYHLLLSPIDNDLTNLSAFMRKVNMGYAKYFNEKYKRTGALWQGKYKSIHVNNDAHFNYIPYYIHLNPLDMKFPEWRKGQVANPKKAIEFLRTYKWSSFLDYQNIKNYPSLIHTQLLKETTGSIKKQQEDMTKIIQDNSTELYSNLLE